MKYFIGVLATALIALCAMDLFAQSQSEVETMSVIYHRIDEEELDIRGYLALPAESEEPAPAIVLIHEWWGLNGYIRGQARRFAEEGYAALAVSLYRNEVADQPSEARRLAVAVRNDMPEAFDNLRAAVAYLQGLDGVDAERIGSIGWCFGGGWSYQMARNNLGVKATVIYYGAFNPADDLSKMRSQIIGHFADRDRSIRVSNVQEFQTKLRTLEGDHEIYIYPNTQHGFASSSSQRIFDEESARLAWERTIEFLSSYL